MKTVILPGYSPKNKDWAEEIKKEIGIDNVIVHKWKHWTRGSFSFNYELNEIEKKIGGGKVNIIAKSVGTRVTMLILKSFPEKIEKLVLCGIPTKGDNEKTFDLYKLGLENISPKRVCVFQNEGDPFAAYSDIVKFIGKINPKIKITKMPRSDHHYPYPNEFKEVLIKS